MDTVTVRRMGEDSTLGIALAEPTRPRLDRERILDAAESIVASEGVGKLTMRRIGAELGADATATYRHFRSKDEMLLALADRLFGSPFEPDAGLCWRDAEKARLRHAMDRYRSHPDLARLLALQPDDTPSLQRVADQTIGMLMKRGLSAEDAARMFHVLENHAVGTGLYYSLIDHADDPRLRDPEAMRRVYAVLPADEYPYAVEAASHLFPDVDETFDFGTDLILDAVEALAKNREPGSPPNEGAPR